MMNVPVVYIVSCCLCCPLYMTMLIFQGLFVCLFFTKTEFCSVSLMGVLFWKMQVLLRNTVENGKELKHLAPVP